MESKVSDMLISDFMRFFVGNEDKYGVHRYDPSEVIVEGKKEKGIWSGWNKDKYKNFIKPNKQTYQKHLEGKEAMGLCPIDSKNNVKFAVLDYDPYLKKEDKMFSVRIKAMVKHVYSSNFPLLCFRSKSGGLHIYMFFKEPIPAKEAIKILRKFMPLLNLPPKTELFPKQERLMGEDSGNWINLPYFNYENPQAYLFGTGLEPMSLGEAVRTIRSKLQTKDTVEEFFSTLPYSDAPPCLQALMINKSITEDTHLRNIFLFNFATYLKSKLGTGDEFKDALQQANMDLPDPVEVKDISAMAGSHMKVNYTYKCKEEPLCSHCNNKECALRKFGVGQGWVSNLDYGALVQYNQEDSAYYEWTINGKLLTFKDENDLIEQKSFIRQCMRKIGFVPQQMKKPTWFKILNEALDGHKIEEISESEDMSNPAMLTVYLKQFITKRKLAESKAQLMIGRVYYHEGHKVYYFRKEALIKFLFETIKFTAMSKPEISMKLKSLSKGHYEIVQTLEWQKTPKSKTTKVVGIPKDFIKEEDMYELTDEQVKVDFKKYNKDPF